MDYAHARHAGNFGDVFKHIALVSVLEALLADAAPLTYVESHAGDGLYALGSTGEWSAGAQKVWPARGAAAKSPQDVVDRYVSLVARWSRPGAERPEKYPGSPLVAQALLRPRDALLLYDIDPTVVKTLEASLGGDARAQVRHGDGLVALPDAVASQAGRRVLALVDPPYTQRSEWDATAAAVCAANAKAPGTTQLIWYPIKALTRPRALLSMLAAGGVHGTVVELISTPLRLKREKLSGSGLVLVNVPERATVSLLASLVRLGPALMTHGEWSAQQNRLLTMLLRTPSDEEIAQAHAHVAEHGYARLGRLLDDAGLEALRLRSEDLMLGRVTYPGFFFQLDAATGRYEDAPLGQGYQGPSLNYRKLEKLEKDPLFRAWMENPAFERIVRARLPGDVVIYRAIIFSKNEAGGSNLPWHQDGGRLFGLDREPELQLWTALDDAPEDGGCLEVVPGSHKGGIAGPLGGLVPRELIESSLAEQRKVSLPAKAGEVLLLHNHVWHRSNASRSGRIRRAFSVCYMDAKTRCTRKKNPRVFPPVFRGPS